MHARSLREDLLGIDGVEGADIDGADDSPSGLRIRIAEGADQHHVGQEIRRVLSAHGLGTDTALPGEGSAPHPEPAMASVSDLAADAEGGSGLGHVDAPEPRRIIDLTDEDSQGPLVAPPAEEAEAPVDAVGARPIVSVDKVAVEEGRSGINVTITTTDGRLEREPARPSEGGVDRAVVLAATRLATPDAPDPIIVDVDERRVEGVDIVMIVLDCNGRMAAGSAVVGAGRAYALARAAWAAVAV